ncbi:hypothetical protein [Streptomyces chromofuscus]|uniref:Secreted protein n=1 Tax=Streptomyces chromofuscus TaxID=42881 RepID=A0A7M2T373_STRCW|nr:hypothetical protein [Streptomyces chromofuscus]QOV42734.1 hypothetical protein IPT68_23395 [Streptomyces chromofuscus]GGS90389.1 hypothetical protein GCM10010254_07820 [Streptomyces chromofuscus]
MHKLQRVAVVAVAVAGLSAFGAGVSFAGEGDTPPVTAVANSSANAVAVGGGYYVQPHAAPEQQKHGEPEQDYGQHGEGEHGEGQHGEGEHGEGE